MNVVEIKERKSEERNAMFWTYTIRGTVMTFRWKWENLMTELVALVLSPQAERMKQMKEEEEM